MNSAPRSKTIIFAVVLKKEITRPLPNNKMHNIRNRKNSII